GYSTIESDLRYVSSRLRSRAVFTMRRAVYTIDSTYCRLVLRPIL
ncbi:15281_t:CDS:1, partial [Gigaspora rosea]